MVVRIEVKNLSTERVKTLLAELAQLHESQLEALKTAAFVPMSPDQWQLYEDRLSRIRKISELLGPQT